MKQSVPGTREEGAQAGPWGWVGGAKFGPSPALVVLEAIRVFSSPSSAIYASRLYLNQYSKSHPERLAQNKPGGPVIRGTSLTPPAASGGSGTRRQDLPWSERWVLLRASSPALCCRERVYPPDSLHRQHCSGECRPRALQQAMLRGAEATVVLTSLPASVLTAGAQCLHWGGCDGGSWCACARVHRPARCLAPCK